MTSDVSSDFCVGLDFIKKPVVAELVYAKFVGAQSHVGCGSCFSIVIQDDEILITLIFLDNLDLLKCGMLSVYHYQLI
ncbi:hypothetical protein TNCT_648071 [Trichonephila clavata]|uniref:Uncharacterized protein n=1 Tax=Trichonephila clavata TaxID=2740835 RepID=A0A8X6KQE6_TRICU|nr:hypothetical protein TNCT_648071 [Trichonephila clavata]